MPAKIADDLVQHGYKFAIDPKLARELEEAEWKAIKAALEKATQDVFIEQAWRKRSLRNLFP